MLSPDIELADLTAYAGDVLAPCPTLVQLGTSVGGGTDDERATVWVDLEALGELVVVGNEHDSRDIVCGIAATLSVSPLAQSVDVLVAGLAELDVVATSRVRSVSAEEIDAALASFSACVAPAVTAAGSSFAARALRPDESLEAVVAICGDRCDVDFATLGPGAAIVRLGTGAEAARWSLVETNGAWSLEPLHLQLSPIRLTPRDGVRLVELLDDACRPPIEVPVVIPESPFEEQPWELQVRVLGSIDVVNRAGLNAEFERSKALELVTWLSQHRGLPLRGLARAALWVTDVRDATFANVVSDARRAMARVAEPPSGEDWIARNDPDRIPIHKLVTSDADLLQARFDHARGEHDAQAAVDVLEPAMSSVRGMPFAGTDYLWPDAEAHPSRLVHLCTSYAAELGARYLDLGRAEDCLDVTQVGLRVLAGQESLVCLRLKAHAALGNLSGVRAEYAAYERAVVSDPWGDGEPAAHVVAERNRLLAGVV